jgi:cell filamentation protein
MRNDYSYQDPDYVYTDPATGILRNKGNIQNHTSLSAFETVKTTNRLNELRQKSLKIKDSNSLFTIHHYLFQDVYDWAGKARTVEISKGGKPFFPTHHFQQALMYLDTLLADYRTTPKSELSKIAEKLAVILDTVNFLHPFREGNGRTQREFLRTLALE